jgi:lauroyl/myristoyl acyltransferase
MQPETTNTSMEQTIDKGRQPVTPLPFFAPISVTQLYSAAPRIIPYVPSRLGYTLCDLLGALVGPRLPIWSNVLGNLSVLMPNTSLAQRQAAGRRVMMRYFKNYFDLFRFPSLSSEALRQTTVVGGAEHVHHSLEGGRGLIVVAPHCGNYTAIVGPLAQKLDVQALLVVEQMVDPQIHSIINRMRQMRGVDIQPLGPTIGRSILHALRRNHVVVLGADRPIAERTVTVDFFGRPSPLPSGPAALALRTGVPVVAVLMGRLPDNRSWARFDPPFKFDQTGDLEQDVYNATQQIAKRMEAFIRHDPSQWMISERVWPET